MEEYEDESSIMVAETIELQQTITNQDDEKADQKPKKSIGHYYIGKWHDSFEI